MSPPTGRRGVQHWEGPSGANPEAEDNGVLREEREADRAAEENVSQGQMTRDAAVSSCPVLRTKTFLYACACNLILCADATLTL